MMQNIASQILNESTPSEQAAPVTPSSESSEQTLNPNPSQGGDFDEKFNVLTKMERKVREERERMRARETEWGEKEKKLSEYEELVKLLDENPLEALKRRKGWGVQEFNEFAVQNASDEDLDPVAQMKKDFMRQLEDRDKTWEQKLSEAIKAKEEEIQAKDHERQATEFKSDLKAFLAENKDTYEFIHAEEGGMDAVFDLIVQDINKQRENEVPDHELKVMSFIDAAEKVEAFLDKQYSKYLSLNKVKSKFNPEDSQGLNAILKRQSAPQTLDNSFSPKSKSNSQLSSEDRKQAAIDFIKSQKSAS
jgi:hypothetical protein